MKINEFFAKYANTPLSLRFTPISFREGGDMTLEQVHKRVKELEDQMRPMRIEEDKLIKLASIVLEKL